jgi:hypothetical protein
MKMATRTIRLAAATTTKMIWLWPKQYQIPPKNGWGALDNQRVLACRVEKGGGQSNWLVATRTAALAR